MKVEKITVEKIFNMNWIIETISKLKMGKINWKDVVNDTGDLFSKY